VLAHDRAGRALRVGPVRHSELDALFVLFEGVVDAREGFPHAPPLTRDVFEATWVLDVTATVAVRVQDGGHRGAPADGSRARGSETLVGAYYLRPNFAGRAAHIANAGYVVAPPWRGRGIGRLLVEDSVRRAPHLGFDAVQFNLVFSSNPARSLYESLGWREIGRVPDAVEGEDAVIYWRRVG